MLVHVIQIMWNRIQELHILSTDFDFVLFFLGGGLILSNVSTDKYRYPNILVHYSCRRLWFKLSRILLVAITNTTVHVLSYLEYEWHESGKNVYIHVTVAVCFAAHFLKAFIFVTSDKNIKRNNLKSITNLYKFLCVRNRH